MKSSSKLTQLSVLILALLCDFPKSSKAFTAPLSPLSARITSTTTTTITPTTAPHLYIQRKITVPPTTTTTTTTTTPTSLKALPGALTALPLSQKIFLSCVLPTCLGFFKREYGVSYAYGGATALSSYWIYKALGAGNLLATWHAGALMFYGVRLCLFLAYREVFVQSIKDSVKRIEDKAKTQGSRLKRAPFILSCAGLYFGLCAPLLVTSQVSISSIPKWTATILKSLVGVTWFGFVLGALGDLNKSIVKAMKGEDHLVTGGLYRFLRHPNYSGEIIGWTANGLAAVVAAIAAQGAGIKPLQLAGYLSASILGAAGLDFVLVQATGGLEKRQEEQYGESEEYKEWVDKSWAGFISPPKVIEDVMEEAEHTKPAIEPKTEKKEDAGSGI